MFPSHDRGGRLSRALESIAIMCQERKVLNPASGKYIRFRLAFVTLTLPQNLTQAQESQAQSTLLKPFLQHLIRRHGVSKYVWRLERTKAGRYHWHMVIDAAIHYKHIQNAWNRVLRVNRMLDQFAKDNGHYNPHSTEIKSIRKVDKSLKYMRKYLSKSEGESESMWIVTGKHSINS